MKLGKYDSLAMWIAWHLPRKVVMWCGYRIGAEATTDKWVAQIVPDLSFMEAMSRWCEEKCKA